MGNQKGELLGPTLITKPNKKTPSLARAQSMKCHRLTGLLHSSQLLFLLGKNALLPLCCGNLHTAFHGCSPQITIFYWSWIKYICWRNIWQVAQTVKNPPSMQETWVGKIPWRREWPPTPVFFSGEFHGQRSLAGHSPWGRKESAMTEQLTLYFRST